MRLTCMLAAAATVALAAGPTIAQDWREVPAENLLIIDTAKGRVLVELVPDLAPNHVERIKTLTRQGFYDGLKFHRVISGTMAQTGDPLGTGLGGSDLPSLTDEFSFRRGRSALFMAASGSGPGARGFYGAVPVQTQPDAQMMVTADGRVSAQPLFCPGVMAMAKTSRPDTANSQFFIMTGEREEMSGDYSAFGRVLAGLDVVRALNAGPRSEDGRVPNPDRMDRVRLAADVAPADRPAARVAVAGSAAYQTALAAARGPEGGVDLCDVNLPVEITE